MDLVQRVRDAIENGDPTDNDNELIREASEEGDVESLRLLLQDGRADPTANDNFPIGVAISEGHTEIVRLLLEDGRADPTYHNNFPIMTATNEGHTDIVRLLLEDGRADPAYNNNEAIILATRQGYTTIVRLLLEDGRADPAADNNEAIILATRQGYTDIVRLLLEDGRADPAADNNAPIMYATRQGYTEIVRMLLEDGRVVPNDLFITAPSSEGYTEIVRLLLEDGRVNPTRRNNEAITMALYKDHIEIGELLLEWYADHNVQINTFINVIPPKYRKYILMYYDINQIPLNTYDFNITDSKENEEFVDEMLASLAYNDEKRERFLRLINPLGYELREAGMGVRGVRNIISEYAGFYPERSSVITETLDDIGIPRSITALIGSLTLQPMRTRAGAGAYL
jgi:ankyrin repeat protein